MTGFSVRARRSGLGTTVLELTGDLDLATAPEMFRAGTGSLDDPNCIALIIDVAGVAFIDSTGIGTWIELRNRAVEQGKSVRLRGVSNNITRILEIGGLVGLFGLDDAPPAQPP